MNYRCNSCQQEYPDPKPDGLPAFHVCYPEIIEHAEFDADGKLIKPEKRTLRTDIRNERPDPALYLSEGKWVRRAPHPEERGQFIEVAAEYAIISEGKGRTLIEADGKGH